MAGPPSGAASPRDWRPNRQLAIRVPIPPSPPPLSHLSLDSLLDRPYISSSSYSVIMAQVIVVGGGLAGLSAAHTLLERGANVLLLDKQP